MVKKFNSLVDECCPIQLIDEKGFLDDSAIETFVKKLKLAESELNYSIVSIIGPQSSGKSTLLNHLFGTKFTEMDELIDRCQTTKGIWLAKSVSTEHSTLVMDLEGTDGSERGLDDTVFEKQTALFALAVSDIIVMNMWCHDIGREQAANKPLFRTVLEVMGKLKLFSVCKTTLLFVIRDKTKSPMNVLERNLLKDIQQIWDSLSKPDGYEEASLHEIFNVEIVALPHYEYEENQFKEQVDGLRHKFFNFGDFGGNARDVLLPSGFSCSAKEIWRVIRENKDLNLPAHKVMVATIRCEEISKESVESFNTNEEWYELNQDVQSHPVPDFGKKLSLILDTCLSEYDMEAKYFDEGVRTEKRRQLKDKMLQLVEPAYYRMLEHIHSRILDQFKGAFQEKLNRSENFNFAAQDCIKSFMNQYDEGCKDVIVKQANWDLSGHRDKLQHDMDSHIAVKISELVTLHKEKLEEELRGHVKKLLVEAHDGTWQTIKNVHKDKTESASHEIYLAASGLKLDEYSYDKIAIRLKDHSRRIIRAKAKEEASNVLTRMNHRFECYFMHDSMSKRYWSEKKVIEATSATASTAALKLLSIMAAVRLGNNEADDDEIVADDDEIEKTLILAFLTNHETIKNIDLLASNVWGQVPLSDTLITPMQCKDIWKQFTKNSEAILIRAQKEACGAAGNDDKGWGFLSGLVAGGAMGLATATAIIGPAGAGCISAAQALSRAGGQLITHLTPILISQLKNLAK